jgi:hypothetical protein
MAQDPNELLKTLADQYRQIKFGSGVVGKTSYAVYSLILVWGVILWRLSGSAALNSCLLVGGVIVTGVVCWWIRSTQKFAEKNPSAALLEGAQLLEYKRFEAQAKGQPSLSGSQTNLQADPQLPSTPVVDPGFEDQ